MKPNVRTYTALIAALGAAKQWERALATLRSLGDDSSAGRVEPNAYTYSALLKAMGEHGQWALAEQVRSRDWAVHVLDPLLRVGKLSTHAVCIIMSTQGFLSFPVP